MSIYFVRFNDLMKIGFSRNLAARVSTIIGAIPAESTFVGHMPGDQEVEAHLHSRFEAQRFSGEWFHVCADILAFAEIALIKEMPQPETCVPSALRQDTSHAWAEVSERFRREAAHRWPEANHSQRKTALSELLAWRPRRVKSLYDCEPNLSLRHVELEMIEEAFASPTETHPTGGDTHLVGARVPNRRATDRKL